MLLRSSNGLDHIGWGTSLVVDSFSFSEPVEVRCVCVLCLQGPLAFPAFTHIELMTRGKNYFGPPGVLK